MKAAHELFNKLSNQSTNLNKAVLGQVLSFKRDSMRVDVQILPSSNYPIIKNIPIATLQRDISSDALRSGDLVLLLVVDYDIDSILVGGDNLQSDRKHNLMDCICLGRIEVD